MTTPSDTSDLSRAWRELAERARSFEGCPEPERLWEAARGELGPQEARELVEHVARCPACAEAWRLARELDPAAAADAADSPPARSRSGRWLAVAAMLVLAVTFGWRYLAERGGDGVERGGPPRVESLLPDGAVLPRDEFLLEWKPGPEGSSYEVLVTTRDLSVVAEGARLGEPRYLVPADALAALADETELLWRVEMVLPDGRRLASRAFRVRVG